ncbi:SRPBCC domain-containing protein [Kitasatospora sp. NPDC002227]|uniref:SRPBCC domain-containing protein n=1 Tax=Kitasatospora sp. NPDC002227 TaxID=3154773 RepID=UPI003330336D
MLSDAIARTLVINAEPERVWAVLTEPSFLGRWFGGGEPVRLDLRPGGLLLFDHGVHGALPARLIRVEPPHTLSWRWSQGPAGEEPTEHNSTLVEFTLAPAAGATSLTVLESGFARLGLPFEEIDARRQANARNWPGKLDQLHQECALTTAQPPGR